MKHDCPTCEKETDATKICGVLYKKVVVDVLQCRECGKFVPIEPKEKNNVEK
jgi:transcription elongation factor Elf1